MATRKASRNEPVIRYRVAIHDAHAHLFAVTVQVDQPDPAGQRLALPVWIPGSYMVREFARNVVEIRAAVVNGKNHRAVPLQKQDKNTWQAPPVDGVLYVTCLIYAWDPSVRAAHLDAQHAFFNGTSLFLRVIGQEDAIHEVDLVRPASVPQSRWRVATTLPEAGAARYGFGTYRAADYDELIDHPVEMGSFELASFSTAGATHEIVISGRVPNLDVQRLCRDLQRICHAQIALFEPARPRAPFKRYVFFITVLTDGYGGLEHRSSTALICARRALPILGDAGLSDAYFTLLGLVSHEYFHSWNVKRIKPAAFASYDLDRENYTRLLWLFEGFTSYYDDLILLRSGLIPAQRYLQALATIIADVRRNGGRRRQSAAESSFDAWIKYYRPDENVGNAVVSYYKKGALIGLGLDLAIRMRTRGRRSLDDVMRALWQQFGRGFYDGEGRGLAEDGFARVVLEATGVDVAALLRQWAYGTVDPPLETLLKPFGVTLSAAPLAAPAKAPMSLGIATKADGGLCRISSVIEGRAAHRAGLAAGDHLLAIDGLRIGADGPCAQLERYATETEVELHLFRRDELMTIRARLERAASEDCVLTIGAGANRLRRSWIG
jgi:predicted metalloprotease with PDZ domain